MGVQPVVGMRVCFPYQPPFSRRTVLELFSTTSVSRCSRGKHTFFTTLCASIPARDVVIDFGKYKGCKMGTLPSRYLQWLIREGNQSSLAVWVDYAKQVLEDPYYKDRLEWQRIEKLSVRGDMRKGSPPAASAGVKGSMMALGWDLSDTDAWSKVNFSLLGTTVGGRIPRKEHDPSLPNPKAAITKRKTVLPKPTMEANTSTSSAGRLSLNRFDPSLSNLKPTMGEANTSIPSGGRLSHNRLDPSMSNLKPTTTNTIANSKRTNPTIGEPQPSQSLSLQEELLRRRQLRKERSAGKSSTTLPPITENLFPGRDSLLKRVRKRAE